MGKQQTIVAKWRKNAQKCPKCTFTESAILSRLPIGHDRFDVESHWSFGRVRPTDDGEAQTLLARTLLEDDGGERVHQVAAGASRQRAKLGRFLLVERRVDGDQRRWRRFLFLRRRVAQRVVEYRRGSPFNLLFQKGEKKKHPISAVLPSSGERVRAADAHSPRHLFSVRFH